MAMIKDLRTKQEINAVVGSGTCWIRCHTYVGHPNELMNKDNVQDYRYDFPNNAACQNKLNEVKKWFHAFCSVMQWPSGR